MKSLFLTVQFLILGAIAIACYALIDWYEYLSFVWIILACGLGCYQILYIASILDLQPRKWLRYVPTQIRMLWK